MSGIYRGPNGSATADALNIDGDKGDLTISNSGLEWTINPDTVDFNKMQNISTDVLLGRASVGSGNIEEITCTQAGRDLLADTDASAQRATLGLGTIATQEANNVSISGGAINGTTVGATSPTTGSFTSLTDSGNLTFTGTGNRITGDFSNATVSNRVMFQTSTTNGVTRLGAIPNGTATQANIGAYNSSDPNNSSITEILTLASESRVQSNVAGTGTFLPMTFHTGGSERMRIAASGNVGIGRTPSLPLDVQCGTDAFGVRVVGRAADGISAILFANNSAVETGRIDVRTTDFRITPAGANPVLFTNTGGFGYGTGAGGSVTQATSKSTAVTLNKPTGQIVMNNAALASGAIVQFTLNNSLLSASDLLIVTNDNGNYTSIASYTIAGAAGIRVTNITGGSLSEAFVIKFAIIKGTPS